MSLSGNNEATLPLPGLEPGAAPSRLGRARLVVCVSSVPATPAVFSEVLPSVVSAVCQGAQAPCVSTLGPLSEACVANLCSQC